MAEWRASLLDKGLNVNAGNSKEIFGNSSGKMIVNSECGPVMYVAKECRKTLSVKNCEGWFTTVIRSGRPIWYRHVMRKCDEEM